MLRQAQKDVGGGAGTFTIKAQDDSAYQRRISNDADTRRPRCCSGAPPFSIPFVRTSGGDFESCVYRLRDSVYSGVCCLLPTLVIYSVIVYSHRNLRATTYMYVWKYTNSMPWLCRMFQRAPPQCSRRASHLRVRVTVPTKPSTSHSL